MYVRPFSSRACEWHLWVDLLQIGKAADKYVSRRHGALSMYDWQAQQLLPTAVSANHPLKSQEPYRIWITYTDNSPFSGNFTRISSLPFVSNNSKSCVVCQIEPGDIIIIMKGFCFFNFFFFWLLFWIKGPHLLSSCALILFKGEKVHNVLFNLLCAFEHDGMKRLIRAEIAVYLTLRVRSLCLSFLPQASPASFRSSIKQNSNFKSLSRCQMRLLRC